MSRSGTVGLSGLIQRRRWREADARVVVAAWQRSGKPKTSDDPFDHWERKRRKCAEVLVPDVLPVPYINGAFVSCDQSLLLLRKEAHNLAIKVDQHFVFL